MIIRTFTDENGHTTVQVTIGKEIQTMSLGEWSRLISNPISSTAPRKPTAA